MSRIGWITSGVLTLAALAVAAVVYQQLPERVPIHWNIHGEVDGYGGRGSIFLMPGFMAAMLGLFAVLPWLSPKRFEVDTFKSAYMAILVAVEAFLFYMHAVILYATMNPRTDVGRWIVAGIFGFLAVLAPMMARVKRNFYIGIRTPWTLASEQVWDDTHRLAVWTMIGGSVVGIVLVLAGMIAWSIGALVVGLGVPVVYSLVHYKRLQRAGRLES